MDASNITIPLVAATLRRGWIDEGGCDVPAR